MRFGLPAMPPFGGVNEPEPSKGLLMADIRNILAAVGGGGANGLSLAFFAPSPTANTVAVTTGTSGVQTVTITGAPAGGTFTLSWNGQTTAPIAYNATAAAVQAAINALTGASSATAGGGPLPSSAVVVTFPAAMVQATLSANGAGLTGGTGPAVAVAVTTAGVRTVNEASAVIPAAYKDAGWCDQKGLTVKTNTSSTDIKGFGSFQVLRTVYTEQKKTADLTFLETNPTSLAVYNSLDLAGVVPRADGSVTLATGTPHVQSYSAIFRAVDGPNLAHYYAPSVQVSNQGDLHISMGAIIDRAVTLTFYPDLAGNVMYETYVLGAFAA